MYLKFSDALEQGQLGESLIAQWFRRRGWHVLPAYEKEIDNGKGPRLFLAAGLSDAQLIVPDLLCIKGKEFIWIEAKHKTRFSWYGKKGYFVTGIDKRHFHDYLKVAELTQRPVWILFLHKESHTWEEDVRKWNAPRTCPTGLFGANIHSINPVGDSKRERYSHDSNEYGLTGMYYWRPHKHLRCIATLDDVLNVRVAA